MGKRKIDIEVDFDKHEERVTMDWIRSGYHWETMRHYDDRMAIIDSHTKMFDKNGEIVEEFNIDMNDETAFAEFMDKIIKLVEKLDQEEKKL